MKNQIYEFVFSRFMYIGYMIQGNQAALKYPL